MPYSQKSTVRSAFKLGYISTIIENELLEEWTNNLELNNYNETSYNYLNILLYFQGEYQKVFHEEFVQLPVYRNETDLIEFLLATFELMKEKASDLENPLLELAFFTGSAVAISFTNNFEFFSKEKLYSILELLFDLCTGDSLAEFDINITKLSSVDLYECMITRNLICEALLGNEFPLEQQTSFKFFDKLIIRKVNH